MKNTLIELAKKSGNGIVNPFGLYIFEESELAKFAELLQANSGNTVDERAAFEAIFPPDWHCGFNEVENEYYLLKLDPSPSGKYTCDDAMRLFVQPQNDRWKVWQARASLANKPDTNPVWVKPRGQFPESSVLCYLKLSNGKVIEGSCRRDWDGIGWHKGYPGLCNGFSMADPDVVGWMYKHETKLTLQELQAITKG